jgi:diguanylate cyclase
MLQQMVRKFDIVGRLGGEEFSIMLPETTLDKAQALAERIRASMQEMRFTFCGQGVTVTVSLGVAQYKPKEPFNIYLQRADVALYEAKHKGRNQVCSSEREG